MSPHPARLVVLLVAILTVLVGAARPGAAQAENPDGAAPAYVLTATLAAADLLGVDDRGALEPGLLADVIAVPGDPLSDVTVLERVSFVMLGGEVYRWGQRRGAQGGLPPELLGGR